MISKILSIVSDYREYKRNRRISNAINTNSSPLPNNKPNYFDCDKLPLVNCDKVYKTSSTDKILKASNRMKEISSDTQKIQNEAMQIEHDAINIYTDSNGSLKELYSEGMELISRGYNSNFETRYYDDCKEKFETTKIPYSKYATIRAYQYTDKKTKTATGCGKMIKIEECDNETNTFKAVVFVNGKLYKYSDGFIKDGEKITQRKYMYQYEDPVPSSCMTGEKHTGNNIVTTDKMYIFNRLGDCIQYKEGIEKTDMNEEKKIRAEYNFEDSKLKDARFEVNKEKGFIKEFYTVLNNGRNHIYCKNFENYINMDFDNLIKTMNSNDTKIEEAYGFEETCEGKLQFRNFIRKSY